MYFKPTNIIGFFALAYLWGIWFQLHSWGFMIWGLRGLSCYLMMVAIDDWRWTMLLRSQNRRNYFSGTYLETFKLKEADDTAIVNNRIRTAASITWGDNFFLLLPRRNHYRGGDMPVCPTPAIAGCPTPLAVGSCQFEVHGTTPPEYQKQPISAIWYNTEVQYIYIYSFAVQALWIDMFMYAMRCSWRTSLIELRTFVHVLNTRRRPKSYSLL